MDEIGRSMQVKSNQIKKYMPRKSKRGDGFRTCGRIGAARRRAASSRCAQRSWVDQTQLECPVSNRRISHGCDSHSGEAERNGGSCVADKKALTLESREIGISSLVVGPGDRRRREATQHMLQPLSPLNHPLGDLSSFRAAALLCFSFASP